MENTLSGKETLQEHLDAQLGCVSLSDLEFQTGQSLISNLDENGFYREEPERFLKPEQLACKDKMVSLIQSFDPSGVGVMNWKESLILQAKNLKLRPEELETFTSMGENPMLAHHMEIRGLGIINLANLFGVGAIRDRKQVQLSVHLEEWDASKSYDRIGGEMTDTFLGITVPKVVIPVKPGRNVPVIIETAARNERLKKLGYYSAKEFDQNVLKWLESETARKMYYIDEDNV